MTRPLRRYTDAEVALLIQWAAERVPVAEQARRLGRKRADIAAKRSRLARAGLLTLAPRAAWRPWTRQDLWKLREKLELGWSYRKIARHLGRTETAVILKCRRRDERLTTLPNIYTSRDVATLLGLGCAKTVTRWIERGWLKGRLGGTAPRRIYRITRADLVDMLHNDETWMAWTPERITEPALRQQMTALRRGASPWVPAGEVARRFHVSINAVNQWAHKGFLPSVKYGNHWYRECDLAGFVVPIDRGFSDAHRAHIRAGIAQRMTPPEAPADAQVYQVGGATIRIWRIEEAA